MRCIWDYVTNGRFMTIQIGLSHSNTDRALCIKDKDANETASIRGDGEIKAQKMNLGNLPTSATGLTTGDLWNDAGTIKIKG